MAKQKKSKDVNVLAEAAQKAGLTDAEFASVRAWLMGLLAANEHAKLGQGGHAIGEIPLSQVFVDLPVYHRMDVEPTPRNLSYFLRQFFARGFFNLADVYPYNPISRDDSIAAETSGTVTYISIAYQSVLLIGGPGQGKSTLGQLACQQYRAGLMRPWQMALPAHQQALIQSFFSATADQATALPAPITLCLPLQIILPDFIGWLANQIGQEADSTAPILFRFLATRPAAAAAGLPPEVLAALAGKISCLLLFDGFDEVGATNDRAHVVAAIRELLGYLAANHVFAKIILTTRPQGYANELSQIGIPLAPIYLTPLRKEDALRYAEKLIQKKFAGADTRQKIWERMQVAAAEPATAHLLSTPLQVTILTSLLEKIGRAPRERWALFHKYFSHIYEREIERQTYASGLLRDHRTHIEQIHQQVGLLLQVESEQTGGAKAGMTPTRLYEVINAVLAEDGIAEAERTTLVHEISLAAEQRLVFLVEPEPGKFGFEIRALQEFMAAWALSNGEDEAVKNRLQRIVRAPMFENVALFMASRFFAEASHLREFVTDQLCENLDADSENELFSLTLAGARLALRILAEGSVLTQPKYARTLMQRACNLFKLPPGDIHLDLAHINNSNTDTVLATQIEQCLIAHNQIAGWVCVIELIRHGTEWALRLGNSYWTKLTEPEALVRTLFGNRIAMPDWVIDKIGPILHQKYIRLHKELNRNKSIKDLLADLPEDLANEMYHGGPAYAFIFSANNLESLLSIIENHQLFFPTLSAESKHIPEVIQEFTEQRTGSLSDTIEWAIALTYLGALPAERDAMLPSEVAACARTKPIILEAFVHALSHKHLPKPRRQALLMRTYELVDVTHPQARAILNHLLALLQFETSGLSQESTWFSLALPAPCPQPDPDTAAPSDIPQQPIHLQSLELQDVRKFRHLELTFTQPAPDSGQWIVILGTNGAGKTTLLRSLALALRNVKDPAIWREEAFVGWARITGKDERAGPARISVGVNGRQHKTTIRSNGTSHFSQEPEQHRPRLFPLFAYGCRRGSALGGASTKVKLGDSGGPEIATLFYEGADLIHAETWLIQMDGDAAKNPDKQVYPAIISALKQLLAVETIEVSERAVWITEPGQNRMPFSFLSDGYLTSAGWFLDLIARWIDLCERHKVPVEANFMDHMRGLVLIDEIDLHLHPRWQIEIIARTRKLLPQMSFIATTHNPLTLVGAEPEEIWILSEEAGKVSARQGLESPMLLTGGQIYRSYFGIEDYYPAELGKALDRYSFLCTFALRSDADEQERLALQAKLRAAKIEPEWEVVPRVALPPPPKKRSRKTAAKPGSAT